MSIAQDRRRVLGVDPGSRRIGLAIGVSGVASPFTVIERHRDLAVTMRTMATIVAEEEINVVVVGLPLHLDGTEGKSAKAARTFVASLSKFIDVPVTFHDERLTTVTADRAMLDAGVKAPERRRNVDKIAAAVMLQSWLDSRAPGAI